jgi:hypothetical protein
LIALLLFVLPAVAFFLLCRGRLEVGLLASIGLGQWLSGAYLSRVSHPSLFAVCLVGTLALIVGYAIAGRQRHRLSSGQRGDPHPTARDVLGWLSIVTAALVAVHFVRGGIPLFSADVETARFQIAGSGLFGLPGRAYLFGLPILVLAYASLRSLSRREMRLFALVLTTFVASRLLGGLKSGLWEVTLVILIAHVVHTGSAPPVLSRPVVRRALIAVLAIVFAGYLGSQYASIQIRSTRDAAGYLIERLTVGTVAAGAYSVEGHGLDLIGPHLARDFLYYADRYTAGIPSSVGLFAPPLYDTSRLVSTGLQGLPVGTTGYVTPVAVGFAPALFLDWRWAGVFVGMAAAGFLMRRLQWLAVETSGIAAGIWGTATLLTIYVVTNGGLAYYVINFAAVAVLYYLASGALTAAAGGAARGKTSPGAMVHEEPGTTAGDPGREAA